MKTEIDADLAKAIDSTAKLRNWFYGVVLTTALAGQASGAAEAFKLGDWWWIAVPFVAALELGGMVWLRNAEVRRRLGEAALLPRVGSAVIALGSAAWCWISHSDSRLGGFFAGMSLLGYATYLMSSENKRRDRLRAERKLEATAPSYGAWQWTRHLWLTRRARALALANAEQRLGEGEYPTTPALGKLASLAAAREQVRAERRERALATSVRKLIADSAGKRMAAIAVDTYDMGEIARRLANHADYDGLAGLLAAELTAEKLAGFSGSDDADNRPNYDLDALVDVVAPDLFDGDELVIVETPPEPPSPQVVPRIRVGKIGRISERASRRLAAKKSAPVPVVPAPVKAPRTTEKTPRKAASRTTTGRPSAAEKVLKAAKVLPAGAPVAEIAKKAGVTPETAKKHLATINGNEVHA